MRINRRKLKFYRRKINYILTLSILIMIFTIGYAFLNTSININGTGYIDKAEWSVYFDSINVKTGSVTPTTAPSITDDTNITFGALLDNPGDFYEFTVNIVNDGTIPAMIDGYTITPTLTEEQANYFDFGVTYSDGAALASKQLLAAGATETLRVYFMYKELANNDLYPIEDQNFQFGLSIDYAQADDTAIAVPHPTFADSVNLGDYISLIPDASTYTISSSITGYDTDQTITPNELTLWRVISKNQDGSVDAVSEYVSSNEVYFKGVQGYANLVGGLQTIAASYAKTGYTIATRMMGYDGQTLTIADTSAFDGTTNTAPSTTSTSSPITGTGQEYSGGVLGDTLYLKDYLLVKNVYGNVIAKKVGATTGTSYWLSSRRFRYRNATDFNFFGRRVDADGSLSSNVLRYFHSSWGGYALNYSVRPILTLKSGVSIASGSGTSASPYILN